MVAQVIVDVVHTNVAHPFSYLVPEGESVPVGARVSVPLGRRRVDGIVVELLENPPDGLPPEKLRERTVVLVDDWSDSGWTLTTAAFLLREAGAAAVHPFVLAQR